MRFPRVDSIVFGERHAADRSPRLPASEQRAAAIPWLLLALFASAVCHAAFAGSDFDHPNSMVGDAGWTGGLEWWVEVGEIPVSEGVSVPLRLRFSSDVARPNSLLGAHWWCPLLESGAKVSDGRLHFTTLGGQRRLVLESEGWRSKDHSASAWIEGNEVRIESGGWQYRYAAGRLLGAVGPGGVALDWCYKDGEVMGIQRGGGAELVRVERFAGGVSVSGEFGRFTLRTEGSSGDGETGILLSYPDGREDHIRIAESALAGDSTHRQDVNGTWHGRTGDDADGGGKESVTTMTVTGRSDEIFRWKTSTGALLSDGDFTYETRRTDTGLDLLHRVDARGDAEWYHFDVGRGLATYKRQDGSRVLSWYQVEHGPTYMKCFRMDTLSAKQELVSSRVLRYGEKGEILEEWTEQGPGSLDGGHQIRFIDGGEAERLHANAGVLFVDARKKDEYLAGHIPGAVRVGRFSFHEDYPLWEQQLRKAGEIVVYCTSRQCEDSGIVASKLVQRGFRNVLLFEGGWAEWWRRHR